MATGGQGSGGAPLALVAQAAAAGLGRDAARGEHDHIGLLNETIVGAFADTDAGSALVGSRWGTNLRPGTTVGIARGRAAGDSCP